MHSAGETSLASCLAARDNKLTVLVPVVEKHRLCCCPYVYGIRPSVCTSANARREKGLCLGGLCSRAMTLPPLPSASPCFAKHQKCYLKVLLWPFFTLRGGNSLREPMALDSFGAVAHSNGDWGEPLFQGHTTPCSKQSTAKLVMPRGFHRKKKAEFVHTRGLGVAALMRENTQWGYNESLCLFLYVEWGQ